MDDILKLYYPEFEDKNLLPLIKKFSSIQNRILIDYKGWRDWILSETKKLEAKDILRSKDGKSTKSGKNNQLKDKIKDLEHRVEDMKKKE